MLSRIDVSEKAIQSAFSYLGNQEGAIFEHYYVVEKAILALVNKDVVTIKNLTDRNRKIFEASNKKMKFISLLEPISLFLEYRKKPSARLKKKIEVSLGINKALFNDYYKSKAIESIIRRELF